MYILHDHANDTINVNNNFIIITNNEYKLRLRGSDDN